VKSYCEIQEYMVSAVLQLLNQSLRLSVADIDDEVLLGIDFLTQKHRQLDVQRCIWHVVVHCRIVKETELNCLLIQLLLY
jgi:hypothetical protein